MDEPLIQQMVNRFLGWELPLDFNPDGGISFDGANKPTGTNLFTAQQAEEMVLHMLAAAPNAPEQTFTTGHCPEKAQPGGCQLHNVHCGYPDCDRMPSNAPEPDARITRTRSDGSRYVELTDAVAKQKADGRWDQIKGVRISNEPVSEGELARLERQIAESVARSRASDAILHEHGWIDVRMVNNSTWFNYLNLRGLLERHPTDHNWVRVKEQVKDDE